MYFSPAVAKIRAFIHESITDDKAGEDELLEVEQALDELCNDLDERQRVIVRLRKQADALAKFRLLALNILAQADKERTEAIDYD